MKLCNHNHEEISFNSEKCPLCKLVKKKGYISADIIMDDIENDLKNIEIMFEQKIASCVVLHEQSANLLLYLLEGVFVGQTGGFDVGQKDHTLVGRFKWMQNLLKEIK